MGVEYLRDGPDKIICPVCGEYPADVELQMKRDGVLFLGCHNNPAHEGVVVRMANIIERGVDGQ